MIYSIVCGALWELFQRVSNAGLTSLPVLHFRLATFIESILPSDWATYVDDCFVCRLLHFFTEVFMQFLQPSVCISSRLGIKLSSFTLTAITYNSAQFYDFITLKYGQDFISQSWKHLGLYRIKLLASINEFILNVLNFIERICNLDRRL